MRRLAYVIAAMVAAVALIALPTAAQATRSWTPPVNISAGGLNGSGDGVLTAVGPNNEIAAAWVHSANGPSEIQVSVSHNAGLSWSTPVTVSEEGNHVENPLVAINGSGAIMVVWSEETTLWKVRSSRSIDGGNSWSGYQTVSDESLSTYGPTLTAVGDTGFALAMEQYNGLFFDVVSRSSNNNGAAWSAFHRLSNGTTNSIFADSSANAAGDVVTSWVESISGRYEIQAISSQDGGLTWGLPVPLNVSVDTANYPDVDAGSGTAFTIVWESVASGQHDLLSSQSGDGGQSWSSPQTVATDVGTLPEFSVGTGPHGLVVTTWAEYGVTTDTAYVAVSPDNGVTWSSPRVVGTADTSSTVPYFRTRALFSSEGILVVAWTAVIDRSGLFDRALAVTSMDDGLTWSPVSDLSGPGGGWVNLAATHVGDVVATWPFLADDEPLDLPAQSSTLMTPSLPDTGVSAQSALWLTILAGVCGVVGVTALMARRRMASRASLD